MNQVDSLSNQEFLASVNEPAHIITLLAIMIVAGVLGGVAGFMIEKNTSTDHKNKNPWFYILIGLCASLLVPLFMTTISSDLLENSQQNHLDYLVFGGFCLIAAISAHKFIVSISEKILKQVDSARDEIAATETRIRQKISDSELKKDIEKELSYLQVNIDKQHFGDFTKEKAFSILDKAQTLSSEEEKTYLFYQLISNYFLAGKYELINEIIQAYSNQINADAYTWANVAIANMNLYSRTLNNAYKEKSVTAARNAMKLQYTYGEPYAILIYLQLIDYASQQTDKEKNESIENINQIFTELDQKTPETAHSAYYYFMKNQDPNNSFRKYNEILQKIFPVKFQKLKEKAGIFDGVTSTGNGTDTGETDMNIVE